MAQRVVYAGAGAAGIGIGRLIARAMSDAGMDESSIRRAQVYVDSKGLLHEGRAVDDLHKQAVSLPLAARESYGLGDGNRELLDVVRAVRPTILIGTTATAGTFTEPIIREMARHVERPIVLPLSNPTSKTECAPEDVIVWTGGRALVATGSPFPPVRFDGSTRLVGQANNAFVFPGLGLGCILSEAHEVTDGMFLAAAMTLADCVTADRLQQGALYPDPSELRLVSRRIAVGVMRQARAEQVGRIIEDDEIEDLVTESMWYPEYPCLSGGDWSWGQKS
jgi:malic enzyme